MTKVITELNFPTDIYYFHEHTWARVEGDVVRVGISDFAQDSLGDIIFVELPNEGESFDKNDEFGQAESAKTVSALYMPLGGKILEVNGDLEENPQNVNQDPYGRGWMIVVKPSDPEEIKGLLSRDDYLRQIQ
ncbi:glycine cleavage system protein GcvH [Desulforamulus aquiferis]|uniref:Glycine cleavage system H protein n=1 Tax=Desulforamulus aquiferis TaxID=1397668 RepID=A0AAW7ZCU6_9FIRM|nr:glycine cleavage system protein GcvH [Desulforamulus aquiferis]MDO7786615.1 glycine cleavage system protein GcvH [Desulforamulus aquiferis]